METIAVNEVKNLLPWFMKHKTYGHLTIRTQILCICILKNLNYADHSEMTDNEIIVRNEQGEIIGFTILNASTR